MFMGSTPTGILAVHLWPAPDLGPGRAFRLFVDSVAARGDSQSRRDCRPNRWFTPSGLAVSIRGEAYKLWAMISEESFVDFKCPYCEEPCPFPATMSGLRELARAAMNQ